MVQQQLAHGAANRVIPGVTDRNGYYDGRSKTKSSQEKGKPAAKNHMGGGRSSVARKKALDKPDLGGLHDGGAVADSNGNSFRSDLKSFVDKNGNCNSALKSVGIDINSLLNTLDHATMVDTVADPAVLGDTYEKLGMLTLVDRQKDVMGLLAPAANAASNVDQQQIYFFKNYFNQSSFERGVTVFHEAFHLLLGLGHIQILAALHVTPVPHYVPGNFIYGPPVNGFPTIIGDEGPTYIGAEGSAGLTLSEWLGRGCK
jgi:hypothetical protein